MLKYENRFSPPEAEVGDVLSFHGDVPELHYKMGKLDFFLFMLVHQFRMPAIQVVSIGISVLAAASLSDSDMRLSIAMGLLAYVAQWTIQAAFLLFVVVFNNERLYTRHEVKPLRDSLAVLTSHARQYYYWHGLERILITPWFVAVYVNKQSAHVIPNRAFRNAEGRKDFVKLVETMRNA